MATLTQRQLYGLADPRLKQSQVLVKADVADPSTLSQILATNPVSQSQRSRSVPPAFRKRDSTARVQGPVRRSDEQSLEDLERRLTYLQERQATYDDYSARPRNVKRPDSRLQTAQFQRKLEETLGPNDAIKSASERIQTYEQKCEQQMQQRYFEWSKRVYEPMSRAVSHAVDQSKEHITATRRRAFDDYLKATNTKKGVFLDDTLSDYDPYQVQRNGIRVLVPVEGADPTKTLLTKARSERAIMDPEGAKSTRWARAKDTLTPIQWTDMAMESTMHGHFESMEKDGVFTMAFAGKDTESTVRLEDWVNPTYTARGRVLETDQEFPPGKKMDYPYRYQPTLPVLRHISMSGVYEREDGPFTDDAQIDNVREAVTKARLEAPPQKPLYGKVYQLARETAAANAETDHLRRSHPV